MFDQQPNTEVALGSDQSFGKVFGAVFSLLALYLFIKGNAFAWVALAIAAGFFVVTAVKPSLLHKANRLWFKFGLILYAIVSPVTMFLVYVIAFVPTGVFVKLRGFDPLSREFDPALQSYWKPRERAPESMKRQY